MGIFILSSVELWVVLTTLLLLAKFAAGSVGLRFSSRRLVVPAVRLLHILNYYAVIYTLGLIKPSTSSCFFFQVWAVLIVTTQQSGNIGRPYRPMEMSLAALVNLLTALWSANELQAAEGTPPKLEVALWLIWSTNAARIIWYYVSSRRTASVAMNGVKIVSDYMATAQHSADDACPRTMRGYRYLVVGEEEQRMDVAPPGFTLEMDLNSPKSRPDRLVTVEKVWQQAAGGDRLLGEAADPDSRFKDACLSFALYKLQRRRFHDIPITEAAHPATRRLVAGAVLEEGPDGGGGYDRALRVTEAELSFLRDSLYSKHAVVFAGGFPYVRLLLSLLMTAANLYLFYAVQNTVDDDSVQDMARNKCDSKDGEKVIYGVFITHCIIAITVCRELMEVGVYLLSQWTKVWIICYYIRMERRQGQGRVATLRRLAVEKAARIMFVAIRRDRWDQRIRQYNLLTSARTKLPRPLVVRKVKLQSEAKRVLFGSLKAMITSVPDHGDHQRASADASWAKRTNLLLMSYFRNAFADGNGPAIEDAAGELEGDTHRILVWHVATSLCQIKLLDEAGQGAGGGADLYSLPPAEQPPPAAGNKDKLAAAAVSSWPRHYAAAVSLSNYCAYLATQALVPDNGLVANMVFDAVRDETRDALRGCGTANLREVRDRIVKLAHDGDDGHGGATIVGMGARLSEKLLSLYEREDLWERLGKFWAGFLLHLSASTRAAKHSTHLQGRGELTTHLWVLLSHAGFLGNTSHGEQLLDPDDLNDA